jgi:glutaredoxin
MGSRYDYQFTRVEVRMEKPVKIYSLSTCSHCKSTKKLLDDCRVKYEFEDVDLLKGEERAAILEDVKKWNPRCSVKPKKI